MTIASRFLSAFMAVCSLGLHLNAQTGDFGLGLDPKTSITNYNIDNVNMSNGNVAINIPLVSLKQRGSLSLNFNFNANTSIWQEATQCNSAAPTCNLVYISASTLPPANTTYGELTEDFAPVVQWTSTPYVSVLGYNWVYNSNYDYFISITLLTPPELPIR